MGVFVVRKELLVSMTGQVESGQLSTVLDYHYIIDNF